MAAFWGATKAPGWPALTIHEEDMMMINARDQISCLASRIAYVLVQLLGIILFFGIGAGIGMGIDLARGGGNLFFGFTLPQVWGVFLALLSLARRGNLQTNKIIDKNRIKL